jgi:hypothetical protein
LQKAPPLEMGKQRQQVGRSNDVKIARPRCLASLRGRADQALVLARRVDCSDEDAPRSRDSPVER